jgi:galactose mutarotase-like enzyme
LNAFAGGLHSSAKAIFKTENPPMPSKTWTLTDVGARTAIEQISLGPADVGGTAVGYSITKQTLRGGLSDGVDLIHVDNGRFAFEALPTRGMGLWKAWLGDLEIGWKSPVRGPVHPKFVPLAEPSGIGWLDGFDELLVRCGLTSNGAPEFDDQGTLQYPLHGRIANRPAHKVEVSVDGDSGEIELTGIVEETRFLYQRLRLTSTIKSQLGEPGLRIHDEVENLAARPAEIQLLYHINFGEPLLAAGSQFVAPVKTLVPRNLHAASGIGSWDRYIAPQAGFEEQVYLMELLAGDGGLTQTLLKNAQNTHGVSLHFNIEQFPCFTLWKNPAASADGYVTGLEPGTNFPNPRSFEQQHGRVVKLAPEQKVCFDLRLEIHTQADEIQRAGESIATLQSAAPSQIFDQPQRTWCA